MKYLLPITVLYYFILIILGMNNVDYLFLYMLTLILVIVSFLYELITTKKILNRATLYMYIGITVTLWELGFNEVIVSFMALAGTVWVIVLFLRKVKLLPQRDNS